ncbi:hypothetical protein LEP1GSC061_1940 [Leptospira wolffii serovar Khorat str. Khorat-H2]|nr:hypothetical protein LEP1GSC061_1940 [Leptospira wolffii serovar Khorat str. Khorat-H2]
MHILPPGSGLKGKLRKLSRNIGFTAGFLPGFWSKGRIPSI